MNLDEHHVLDAEIRQVKSVLISFSVHRGFGAVTWVLQKPSK